MSTYNSDLSAMDLSATPSPCVRSCCLDNHDTCLGCGRLLTEILEWHAADPRRKQEITSKARQRQGRSR